MKTVLRLDQGEQASKVTKLSNGWVRLEGTLTTTGVFPYRRPDGTIRRELRLPEEVFHEDALASFRMIPVTDLHPPPGLLNDENTEEWARGSVGETYERVRLDNGEEGLKSSMLITSGDLTEDVLAKKKSQLSVGYRCELEKSPGVYKGQRYDVIQRKIRANHVACVPLGRAGPMAVVHLDAADQLDAAEQVVLLDQAEGGDPRPNPKEHTVKIRLDSVDFEAGEQLAQAITREQEKAQARFDAKDAEVKAAKAETEKLQARFDAQGEELRKAKEDLVAAPAKLKAELSELASLRETARDVLGKGVRLDSLDATGIRKAVLKKLAPKADLEGKSEAYVVARFDAAVEAFEAEEVEHEDADEALDEAREAAEGEHLDEADEDEDEDGEEDDEHLDSEDGRGVARVPDADAARARMMKQHRTAYIRKEKDA